VSRCGGPRNLCNLSPVYVFVRRHEKVGLGQALRLKCEDRFIPLSEDPEKFLGCSHRRKIHFEHVLEAAAASNINRVTVLMYGCKSNWPLFLWLDDLDVDFEIDLGHVLTPSTPGIHLVGKGQNVDIGGFGISIWPMLTSLQRDDAQWMGSAYLQSPDRTQPINGIYGVKVYPSVIHVVKGLATANFMTLPPNCIAAGRRRAQVAQLLQQLKCRDYSRDVGKLRTEVSLKVVGSLSRAAEVARQVGRDVMPCLQFRTISYHDFVQELEWMSHWWATCALE